MDKLPKQLQKLEKKTTNLLRRITVLCLCCGGRKTTKSSVPRGCLPVYVGSESHRFIVDIHYLSHPLFEELLELSAEEFGYPEKGGIRVACNVDFFEYLMRLLNSGNPSSCRFLEVTDLLHQFTGSSSSGACN